MERCFPVAVLHRQRLSGVQRCQPHQNGAVADYLRIWKVQCQGKSVECALSWVLGSLPWPTGSSGLGSVPWPCYNGSWVLGSLPWHLGSCCLEVLGSSPWLFLFLLEYVTHQQC